MARPRFAKYIQRERRACSEAGYKVVYVLPQPFIDEAVHFLIANLFDHLEDFHDVDVMHRFLVEKARQPAGMPIGEIGGGQVKALSAACLDLAGGNAPSSGLSACSLRPRFGAELIRRRRGLDNLCTGDTPCVS